MTMDDPFDDIIAGLDFEEPKDVIDVSQMSTVDLLTMFYELNLELFGRGEGLRPHSQEARDKHSLRNAIQVELALRKGEPE